MKTEADTSNTTNARAKSSSAEAGRKPGAAAWIYLVVGWFVPGAGHLMLRKWVRGTLIFLSILSMYVIGMSLRGKVYQPNVSDPLDLLGFLGDLGSGMPYLLTHFLDLGHAVVKTAVADYGTKFIVGAGLLNVIAAVDAHSLASGRKQP